MEEVNAIHRAASDIWDESPKEYKVLYSGISVLDRFLSGFKSSNFYLLDGTAGFVLDFTYLLCVKAVINLGDVVYLDGGNQINPYLISSLCKRFRVNKDEVLSKINVARAFTAYQMVSLVDALEKTVIETNARMIIISSFPALFCDNELWGSESGTLFRQCASKIRELTRKYATITLVTDVCGSSNERNKGFKKILYLNADEAVRFKQRKKILRVWLGSKNAYMDYYPVPLNQTTIDDFLEGDLNG